MSEKLIQGYLTKKSWEVKENANTDYSLSGMHMHVFENHIKEFMLTKHYSEQIKKAANEGYVYIHDLGYLSNYCCGHDLKKLLEQGINGVPGKVSSSPPKHLRSAVNQMVNYLYVMQSENAGAQAFSNVDTFLAPFVKHDNLKYEDIKQAMQEFIYSMNFPTRSGMQAVFSNVTFDIKCPEMFKEKIPLINGIRMDFKYSDCNEEMGLITKAFFEIMMEGDYDGQPFTFPIPTINLHKNFVWDDEVAMTIFEATAKYGTPNFQNFINSDINPEDTYSMCCRLRLDMKELEKNTGGVFGSSPNTGSIGVVTMNLPRMAYEAKLKKKNMLEKNHAGKIVKKNGSLHTEKDEFMEMLGRFMDIGKESLETKRTLINQMVDQGLYPYMTRYIKQFKTFFSTIAVIGGNEACLNLLGEDISTPEGKKFITEVLDFMSSKLSEYQEETGNLYNLEQAPAESTAFKLAKKDREIHPKIKAAGTIEQPYYTNSTHLAVDHTLSLIKMLNHQEGLNELYNGGTACHVFLGEKVSDWINCMLLVKKIAEKTTLPFFDITPTYSICPIHGYISGEHQMCPLDHTQDQLEKYGKYIKEEETNEENN